MRRLFLIVLLVSGCTCPEARIQYLIEEHDRIRYMQDQENRARLRRDNTLGVNPPVRT